MVQFKLPRNSKVKKGIQHHMKERSDSTKIVVIYRWNPDDDENPRLDTYEIDLKNRDYSF